MNRLKDLSFLCLFRHRHRAKSMKPGPSGPSSHQPTTLSPAQQRGMDQLRALLLEASAQGHMMAQAVCGDMYCFGMGVAKDEHLEFLYQEKAARQGHLVCPWYVRC
eukprot:FR739295.1.p1 GENE.FR739295.1~~FR739295.1.p1  ORF type:complete len:106 (+),score=1.22 FR739295.1:274-591(+)